VLPIVSLWEGSSSNLNFQWGLGALFSKLTLFSGATVTGLSEATDIWALSCFLSGALGLLLSNPLPLYVHLKWQTLWFWESQDSLSCDFSNPLDCSVLKCVWLQRTSEICQGSLSDLFCKFSIVS
jgi:hypothetical protein